LYVKEGQWQGSGVKERRERERKGYEGMKRIEVHYVRVSLHSIIKPTKQAWHWWLTPIILATQEAEIRKIMV
jgi:hypothetical protein